MTVLGLRCSACFALVVACQGCSPAAVCGLPPAVASPPAEHGFQQLRLSGCGSQPLEHRFSSLWHGLSCSVTCGDLPGSRAEPMSPAFGRQILYHGATREA